MSTKIEYVNETWNPITGCSPVSEGCKNCYARRMANRLRGRFGYPEDEPFRVTFHPDRLKQPLKWKKPRLIFISSMGDLFHDNVKNHLEWPLSIFKVTRLANQHIYLILTKRIQNVVEYLRHPLSFQFGNNIWLGVTAENQKRADGRIPILLQIPAAVRFVSVEPCLSKINLTPYLHCGIGWVVIGAESGPKKRYFNPKWAERIISQCEEAKIPVFYKQDSNQKMPMVNGKIYAQFPGSINKTNG